MDRPARLAGGTSAIRTTPLVNAALRSRHPFINCTLDAFPAMSIPKTGKFLGSFKLPGVKKNAPGSKHPTPSVSSGSGSGSGSDYALPELSFRRELNSPGSLNRSSASKISDSSSRGTVSVGKSRKHPKIPSSFLKGGESLVRGNPQQEEIRPKLQRRNAFREKTPGITRRARFMNIGQLGDVKSSMDRYEKSNHDLDTRSSLSTGELKSRIEKRLSDMDAIELSLQGRFIGLGVGGQIADYKNQVLAEKVCLSRVHRMVSEAELQGITIDLSLSDLMFLMARDVSSESILLGMVHGMNAYTILLLTQRYAELGIPFNEHTLPSQLFCDANADMEAKRELGSGAMSTVWLIPYIDPVTETIYQMVFKPESDNPNIPPDFLAHGIGCTPRMKKLSDGTVAYIGEGVTRTPANLPGRMVATYRVDQLLNTQLVPPTFLSKSGKDVGTLMGLAPGASPRATGKVHMTLEPELARWLRGDPDALKAYAAAQGYSGASLDDDGRLMLTREGHGTYDNFILLHTDFDDARLREGLIRLQWLDALCGQLDRNPQNYFIDEHMRVFAIDNDLSFGSVTTRFGVDGCPPLPKLVTPELRKTFLRLDESELRAVLSPLLSKAEVEAAVERLNLIQAELAKTGPEAVMVVTTPDEWLSDEANERLGVVSPEPDGRLSNTNTEKANRAGYLGRDRAYVQETRWMNDHVPSPHMQMPIFSPAQVRQDLRREQDMAIKNA
jgi:hypothetical protein